MVTMELVVTLLWCFMVTGDIRNGRAGATIGEDRVRSYDPE
jgi:hypothetical protein